MSPIEDKASSSAMTLMYLGLVGGRNCNCILSSSNFLPVFLTYNLSLSLAANSFKMAICCKIPSCIALLMPRNSASSPSSSRPSTPDSRVPFDGVKKPVLS